MNLLETARAHIEPLVRSPLGPLVRVLAALGIRPNQVTVGAVVLSGAGALLVARGWFVAAAAVVLAGGLLDLLDGMLARHMGLASPFGAFLDSTLDRVSEGVVFAAIAYHFALRGQGLVVACVVLALLGSLLVSYARARAEALGIDCKVGTTTRAERVLLVVIGLAFNVLAPIIVALAVLSAMTVIQRMVHVHQALRARA